MAVDKTNTTALSPINIPNRPRSRRSLVILNRVWYMAGPYDSHLQQGVEVEGGDSSIQHHLIVQKQRPYQGIRVALWGVRVCKPW